MSKPVLRSQPEFCCTQAWRAHEYYGLMELYACRQRALSTLGPMRAPPPKYTVWRAYVAVILHDAINGKRSNCTER